MTDTDEYEYMVTHSKSGESDGSFATYEEAKAHYDYLCSEGDPDSARYYFIEEVRKEDEEDEEDEDIYLWSITYEVNGKLYTTKTDYDHSWLCDIHMEDLVLLEEGEEE